MYATALTFCLYPKVQLCRYHTLPISDCLPGQTLKQCNSIKTYRASNFQLFRMSEGRVIWLLRFCMLSLTSFHQRREACSASCYTLSSRGQDWKAACQKSKTKVCCPGHTWSTASAWRLPRLWGMVLKSARRCLYRDHTLEFMSLWWLWTGFEWSGAGGK